MATISLELFFLLAKPVARKRKTMRIGQSSLAVIREVEYHLSMSSYTAILKQDGDYWIGWIEEVPGVNAQEKTKEALLVSLKEILREALEFNREEAREAAEAGYIEELITV